MQLLTAAGGQDSLFHTTEKKRARRHTPDAVPTCNTLTRCQELATLILNVAPEILLLLPGWAVSPTRASFCTSSPVPGARTPPHPTWPARAQAAAPRPDPPAPLPTYQGFWAPPRPPAAGRSPASPWLRDPPSCLLCQMSSGSRDAGPWARSPVRSLLPTCGCGRRRLWESSRGRGGRTGGDSSGSG